MQSKVPVTAVQGEGRDGVKDYMERRGLILISDTGMVERMIDEVLAANPKQLRQYCSGKTKLQGFFVG
jgi:aspartyl-tRNA(Asn)/glutamyl-tRNA(Gln) amidotransferase subunit B